MVEVVWLGVHDGALTYRASRAALGADEPPDIAARALAGDDASSAPPALLHSTSWRYEHGLVVLTYAAACDPTPHHGRLLSPVPPARSDDLLAPCPPAVTVAQVAAHACRHLAMLHATDRQIAGCAADAPQFWQLIATHEAVPAGELLSQGR
ncbi:hypothetical protein R8Z50_22110 [Longispora sp. K20-0274]|uniref:hypothetical protein n=1 Tax=Longispora sp. K20-0274 TaxID=3088255 RepID=UPI00399B4AFA